ncbi:MAG: hypothetical protein JO332_00975 [Planctomycetaceae bacterium]|nr:hypothetical protein [Planctomycetaceae bacterium]
MTKEGKSRDGGSLTILAIAGVLGLGALGLVFYFRDQADQAEKLVLRSKEEYREMQEKMKKPVEEFIRLRKNRTGQPKEDSGDMLTFLDRKAREAQVPPGYTVTKNATATVGIWQESSYTVSLQSEKKDVPVKRNPVVDFIGRVERERRSTKVKSLQLTFAGDDFKSAIIGFSQFQAK